MSGQMARLCEDEVFREAGGKGMKRRETWIGRARRRVFASLGAALLAACATPPPVPQAAQRTDSRPAWIENPGEGVSASAGLHVKGRVKQEELAISRAREELAKRKGVHVESTQDISETYASGRLTTIADKEVAETVSGADVKSRVTAKWVDPQNGAIWVLVVPDP